MPAAVHRGDGPAEAEAHLKIPDPWIQAGLQSKGCLWGACTLSLRLATHAWETVSAVRGMLSCLFVDPLNLCFSLLCYPCVIVCEEVPCRSQGEQVIAMRTLCRMGLKSGRHNKLLQHPI